MFRCSVPARENFFLSSACLSAFLSLQLWPPILAALRRCSTSRTALPIPPSGLGGSACLPWYVSFNFFLTGSSFLCSFWSVALQIQRAVSGFGHAAAQLDLQGAAINQNTTKYQLTTQPRLHFPLRRSMCEKTRLHYYVECLELNKAIYQGRSAVQDVEQGE